MTSQNGSIDGQALTSVASGTGRPDPEVPERLERARRRQFTVGYKLRILSEADAARTMGELGALLRREGLYSSHLAAWRRQRADGILHALSPRRRGRPTSSPEQRELARLRQENERLSQRLVAAEAVIDVQKKLRCCSGWSSRVVRATSVPDGERDRAAARRRGGQGLRGGRRGPCQLLPGGAATPRPVGSLFTAKPEARGRGRRAQRAERPGRVGGGGPGASARPECRRTGGGAGRAACAPLPGRCSRCC